MMINIGEYLYVLLYSQGHILIFPQSTFMVNISIYFMGNKF